MNNPDQEIIIKSEIESLKSKISDLEDALKLSVFFHDEDIKLIHTYHTYKIPCFTLFGFAFGFKEEYTECVKLTWNIPGIENPVVREYPLAVWQDIGFILSLVPNLKETKAKLLAQQKSIK